MRKIFTFLLALAASVGMSWAFTPLEGDTWDDATKTLTVNSNTGNSAYASQTEIKHLIVSDAVTELGWGTFFFDSLMTTVELGNNLETIGISAFNECRSLSTITVPASVTYIGVRAFRNSTSLTTFTCEAVTPPTIGNAIFENDNNLTAIYVPAASVDAYKSAWSDYASLIEAIGGEPVLVTAYTLQLHVNDAAMGSVAVTNLLGGDIVDNGDGTYDVPEGAEVTLQATPNEGYEFIGWKASSTICDFADCEFVALPTVDNPMTIGMHQEVAIMAEFKASAPTTPTVYNSGSVALRNLNVGDILMAGVTLTDDSGSKVKFVPGRLKIIKNIRDSEFTVANFVNSLQTPLLGENAAMTFPGGLTITPINEEREDGNAWVVTEINVAEDTPVALAGITYSGTEPDPATPTVWTSLKVGDVIKVGDQLSPSEEWKSANDHGIIKPDWAPYTLLRANIAQDEYDEPVVTEAEDGAYYVLKFTHPSAGTYYLLANPAKCTLLAATATSDGLEVTNVEDYYGPQFTFAVHESGSAPTAVENVQTNQVQGTKILRDGQLLIEKNGKIYNVMGAEVK